MREHLLAKGLIAEDDADADETLPTGLFTYWEGWQALRHDRQYGAMGGCSGISYLALSRYAGDHGIADGEFHIFTTLIRAMDAEYMDWLHQSQQQNSPAGGSPA